VCSACSGDRGILRVREQCTTPARPQALKFYQDQLPNPVGVTKVNAAVVGEGLTASTLKFFFIHPDDIQRHGLPDWLKGCNSVLKPHPLGVEQLAKRSLQQLMRSVDVPALTFTGLVQQEGVSSVRFLKLDVEGQEAAILESVIDACKKDHALWPHKILFETAHMNSTAKHTYLAKLHSHGYVTVPNEDGSIAPRGNDATLRRTDDSAMHTHKGQDIKSSVEK